jgi:VWFA-related protein
MALGGCNTIAFECITHFMRKSLLALPAVVCLGILAAQEAETVLKVDVNVVNVLFSVRDKKGALIGNLAKDDFTVSEEGKQQTIKSFTRESDLPLTIGLLVDVSGSQRNLIGVEKQAASEFFGKVLRPKDMAFLISFGSEAELLQDSTNSVRLLKTGLDNLRENSGVGGFHPGPVPTIGKTRGTILYDAVYLAADEKLKGEVGRKAIVLITDGVDMGSRQTLRDAIDAAHRADTIIYSIQYLDQGAYGGFGMGGDGDLKKMSEETGGRMFRVDRKHTLDDIFREIQEEMRTQYSLSYTPTIEGDGPPFRKIEIKTPNRKDLKVQARKGYFSSSAK